MGLGQNASLSYLFQVNSGPYQISNLISDLISDEGSRAQGAQGGGAQGVPGGAVGWEQLRGCCERLHRPLLDSGELRGSRAKDGLGAKRTG